MNRFVKYLIIGLVYGILFPFSGTIWAQSTPANDIAQLQLLLEGMNDDEKPEDTQQLLDELMPLLERKIPINNASLADLEPLFFLSPTQQNALIDYRKKYGDILSVYELPLIEGFDEYTAQLAALFFNFSPTGTHIGSMRNHHDFIMRTSSVIQQQAAYSSGKFEGDAHRLYFRYQGNLQKLEFGFTGEKDPGESFFRKTNLQGFDYQSAFVALKLKQTQSKIIVGDYIVQWGQGLGVWQGFSVGKSADTQQIVRLNEGIKPYSSTDENNFMRGIAAQLRLGKHWEIMPYFSYKSVDANIDTIQNQPIITSLQSSGLHRTASEVKNKHNVKLISSGAKLNYRLNSLKLGIAYNQIRISLPIIPVNQAYNKYLFQGNKQELLSGTYQYNFNRLFLFGETTTDGSGFATLNGMQIQPSSIFNLVLQYRKISKNYNALYASAQTESSRTNDEEGWYIGVKVSPIAKLTINAYADFFQFSWLKYTTAAPSKGREFLLRGVYSLNPDWELNGRYFYECKPQKTQTDKITHNSERIRQSLRLQLSGQSSKHLLFRSRLEFNKYNHQENSSGLFLAQDIGFVSKKGSFKSWFRLAYFNTDDYNSRIYAYENDVRYQFYIPSFYGEGIRSYFTLNYRIQRRWQFEFKLASTLYLNDESIGSGLTAIDGKQRSEWKVQVRYSM
ncbi:MAG: helix-hairpin-helix domain-containing protein [Mangrovibacterium sp.]